MSVPSRAVTLTSRDGTRIAAKVCEPVKSRATVVLCHGVGEHSGRYGRLVTQLVEAGITALPFAFRGHGQSGGVKGHVDGFDEYLDDLEAVLNYLTSLRRSEPWFLFGHSMGGIVVSRYLLTRAVAKPPRGIVLSSPGFELALAVPVYKRVIARCLLRLAPKLRFDSGIRPRHLTSVTEAQRSFETDPFTYGAVSLRWFDEFERAAKSCLQNPAALTLPMLVCVGAVDPVIAPAATERFVANAKSADKTFLSWEGNLHEPLNDRRGDEVARTIVDWIVERAAS